MITVLVITLATLVVLACAVCLVMVSMAYMLTNRMVYIWQRLESLLIEIQRNTRKP